MKNLQQFINDETGVLSFEWIVIITVLVIGIVGGMSALRDATICEFGGVANAAAKLDQSFGDTSLPPTNAKNPYGCYDGKSPRP